MIEFETFFEAKRVESTLFRVEITSCIDFYCGFDEKNNYCLALKAKRPFPTIESTKLLYFEKRTEMVPNTYWLYISLLNSEAKKVFFSLCSDIYGCLENQTDVEAALVIIKNRFAWWKKMFSRASKPLSDEMIKGLFGELTFLYDYLSKEIGLESAVRSWTGPLGTSKDFAYSDTWFEIKTISVNRDTVKISSLNQLDDPKDGYLVVLKVEDTAEMADEPSSDLMSIYETIHDAITASGDISLLETFFERIGKSGFVPDEAYRNIKFRKKDPLFYLVTKDFPRLSAKDISRPEISKITYELIINTLERFKAEPWKL